MSEKKNILLTGGAGFIGSNLCQALSEQGHNITILDNLEPQVHGKKSKDSPTYKAIKNKSTFIKGDVRNNKSWRKALDNQEVVVHLAAETGTGQSMHEVEKYVDVNIKGTAQLLDILANTKHSIKKVILASSRAIYGEGKHQCRKCGIVYPNLRKVEDMEKGDYNVKCPQCNANTVALATDESSDKLPVSIYGITKKTQEEMVLLSCRSSGIPTIALRFQNVYGPGQSLSNPYTGIISIFSNRILNGNPINIFEDGVESRDFIYINDAVKALQLAIQDDTISWDSFNVGTGVATNVLDIARILVTKLNSNTEISISGNFRIGDIRHNFSEPTYIKNRLSFTPEYSFERGIEEYIQWLVKQNKDEDLYKTSIQELRDRGLYK